MSNQKGFAPWKPSKATQVFLDEVLEVLNEQKELWPLTQRYWLYRLMAKKGWLKVDEYQPSKNDKSKRHLCTPGKNLNNILNRGRRAEIIPWEAVSGSRGVDNPPRTSSNADQLARLIKSNIDNWQFDRQEGQERRIVLWMETEGMVSLVEKTAHYYGATILAGQGFDILDKKHKFAELVARQKKVLILHAGDLDKSGHSVFTTLNEDIQAFVSDMGGQMELKRIALTENQAVHFGLQTSLASKGLNKGNHGKGFVSSNNDKFNQDKVEFTPKEKDLRDAIDNKELVLYYQPQINMKMRNLHGAEALVRWLHPEFGIIPPDKFIVLAEQTGLIEQLTEEVIQLAISQSVHWQKLNKSIRLSINISAQNINSLKLPEQLRMLVKEYELDPSMIVLELTESALMDSVVTSLDILTRLRLKGFQLSIDDFGTGYSSLSQLHKIPFTELKVDQSFVTNMKQNHESKAIVETCIMLAHKLNMEVVAEGVEDKETWDLLLAEDCDIAQGYYIAKPMPALEFDKWKFYG